MRSLSSFALCFVWLAVSPAVAQTTTAELSGSVTDPSGGAIAKARVMAANTGTGLSYDVVSDDSGGYLWSRSSRRPTSPASDRAARYQSSGVKIPFSTPTA
jgi:hypothetical protein